MGTRNTTFMLLAATAIAVAGCSNNDYGDEPQPAPANQAPVISAIADVTTNQDTVVGPVAFSISDDSTPANQITVTATADGASPIPADGVVLAGSGGMRTFTLVPLEAQAGMATVTVRVIDAQGLVATRVFNVTVNTRAASVRDAVTSTFAKEEADAATPLNGFTFAQDADDPAVFAGLLGEE